MMKSSQSERFPPVAVKEDNLGASFRVVQEPGMNTLPVSSLNPYFLIGNSDVLGCEVQTSNGKEGQARFQYARQELECRNPGEQSYQAKQKSF